MSGTGEQTQAELDALKKKTKPTGAAPANDEGEADDTDPTDSESDDEGDADDFGDPVKAKAAVVKLRKEAAKYRNLKNASDEALKAAQTRIDSFKKALGVEDESEDPETTINTLKSQNQALAMEMSIAQIAREHNIPADQDKYFRFLLNERMESLEDGEEISDEDITEIAAQIEKISGKASGNSTGLNGQKKKPAGGNTLTVEAFSKMNSGEKSELYGRNPEEYNRLFAEAKTKRLI